MKRSFSVVAAFVLLLCAAIPTVSAAAPPPPGPPLGPVPVLTADVAVDILAPSPYASPFEYVITVADRGRLTASNVVLEMDLAQDSIWQTVSTTQGACAFGPFSATVDLRCTLNSVGPFTPVQIRVVVHPYRTQQTIVANVTTSSSDSNLANNTATSSMVLPAVGVSDLGVSLVDSPDPVSVGNKLVYTATISPGGDDDARDVVLVDLLPPSVRYHDGFTSVGTQCDHAPTPLGEAVRCKVGQMATVGNVTVTLVVEPLVAGLIYNSVSVSQSTVDPTDGPYVNSASARTWVNP